MHLKFTSGLRVVGSYPGYDVVPLVVVGSVGTSVGFVVVGFSGLKVVVGLFVGF